MFSRTMRSLRHSLALRLTLWYAGIFAATSILGFALVYFLIFSIVRAREDRELREDLGEYVTLLEEGGIDRVQAELAQEAQDPRAMEGFFRLGAADGREWTAVGCTPPEGRATPEILAELAGGEDLVWRTLELPGREHGFRAVYGTIGPGTVLGIGKSLEEDNDLVAAFLNGFLLTLAAIIALGVPIGWFMARQALGGVGDVTRAAREIADGALDRRVTVHSRGDELDLLAQTFNTMLDRIQALIHGMREMTDSLAHDIRSPLARIRASAEMALASAGSPAEFESLAATASEECERLMQMIDATLDIAEAESGTIRLTPAEIDLAAVVHDACDVFRTIAEDKRILLSVEAARPVRVLGDLQMLQRVIANLLDNALKYTPEGGAVKILLTGEGDRVRLSLADTGIGISAEELPRIFQRFYRCDRSRSDRGNGLGLSLALAFVRAHGGDIAVESTPGAGSVFTVTLPAAAFSTPGRTSIRGDRDPGRPPRTNLADTLPSR